MNNFKKFITAVAVGMIILPASASGNPAKQQGNRVNTLKFRHERTFPEGLYAVPPQAKVSRVPIRKSTAGRTELVANSLTSKIGYGMFSFYAENDLAPQKLADTPPFFGGAVYVNGKYYGADYDYDANYQLTYVKWYVYDALTWQCEKEVENPLDFSYIATDRTYDATSGKVYSIVYDKSGSSIQLATTSLADGASTPIGTLGKDVITITADDKGQLYGIDTNANLYRINKSTAELTLVGNTNILDDYLSDYTQSITFDPESKKILWAEFHSVGLGYPAAALYEVNPANASTVKIADIPGNPELVGLYVTDYVASDVPDAVTNLNITPATVGSLNYTFTFKAPAKTTGGAAITETMTIEVSVDGDLLDIKEASAGQNVTCGPITLTRGLHNVKITAETAAGSGVVTARVFFAGYDVPAAPTGVTLKDNNGNLTVSWTAPKTGAQGGAIRTPLTYDVVRMPDNVKVGNKITATSFSETVTNPARYYYVITPYTSEGEGISAESNNLVAGSCSVPFITSFDTQSEFDLWTTVDITSGGKVWNYDEDNHRLRHPWSIDNAMDDYIVSPPIKMDASKSYSVSFDAYQMVDSYDEHVMLYFGTSSDVSKMTQILDTKKLPTDAKTFEATVAPATSGNCYIAFRSTAPRNGFMSYVDNVCIIEKGSSNVAATVDNLVAKGADNGELKINISFDAPSKTMQGTALAAISNIDIIRGESTEPIKTFASPAPGSHLTWTDSSVKTGKYTYRVVVYTSAGAGEPNAVTAFAGVDTPEAPTDLNVTGNDGRRIISWKAPAQGVNGGNLTGVVSYRLVRMVNDNEQVIDENLTTTEYTDTWTTHEQAFVYYAVSAVTSAGSSNIINSRSFAVGDPYELPYKESFAGGKPQTNPWVIEQVTGAQGCWAILNKGENPYIDAQDGDNGLATFDGYHGWTDGVELRLISPTISTRIYKDVKLSFYIYHYNGSAGWWQETPDPVGESMIVEVSEDGAPFVAIPGASYKLYDSKSAWKKYEVSLDNYRKTRGIRVAFRGKGAGNFNIHLDNIAIDGIYDSTAVDEIGTTVAFAYGERGLIRFGGLEGEVNVYDMAGRHVAKADSADGMVSVAAGIYAVVCGNETFKVIVK